MTASKPTLEDLNEIVQIADGITSVNEGRLNNLSIELAPYMASELIALRQGKERIREMLKERLEQVMPEEYYQDERTLDELGITVRIGLRMSEARELLSILAPGEGT